MNVKSILVALALVVAVGTISAQTAAAPKDAAKTSCCADGKKDKCCKTDASKSCKIEAGKSCEKASCGMKAKSGEKCPKCVDANKSGSCSHKEAKK